MALKTTHSEGDIFYAGATTDEDKLNGITNEIVQNRVRTWITTKRMDEEIISITPHSATKWSGIEAIDKDLYQSTDAGLTWTEIVDAITVDEIVPCIADSTKAIAYDVGGTTIKITSDSGDNWANPSVAPANLTTIESISYITATKAVLVGVAGVGDGVWYSNDAGDNWTQGSGDTLADNRAVSMYDGSNGFCVDSNENIHVTNDGGATWSDTGQNVILFHDEITFCAISATAFWYFKYDEAGGLAPSLYYGTTAITPYKIWQGGGSNTVHSCTNFLKSTNGYYYLAVRNDTGSEYGDYLLKLDTSNVSTVLVKFLPAGNFWTGLSNQRGLGLQEYTTDKFVMAQYLGSAPTEAVQILIDESEVS